MMLGGLLALLLAGWKDTIPLFILTQDLYGCIFIRINWHCLRGHKPLDLICSSFTVIFNLHVGNKDTPLLLR